MTFDIHDNDNILISLVINMLINIKNNQTLELLE